MSTTPTVVVRTSPHAGDVQWPPSWPLPRVGESVWLQVDGAPVYWVHDIEWYPLGDGPDDPAPFVALILRDREVVW